VQLSVTGRHIQITSSMKRYAEEKAAKLPRFYDRIEAISFILDQESTNFRLELVARADHKNTFVAQVDADDFYKAVDLVVDKLERQLKKHKEKQRNRKHQQPAKSSTPSPTEETTNPGS